MMPVRQYVCHKSTQITEHFESIFFFVLTYISGFFEQKLGPTNDEKTSTHQRHENVTKGVNLHHITQTFNNLHPTDSFYEIFGFFSFYFS